MATLLLWLVIPGVLINSFCVPFSVAKLQQLGLSTLLGVLALLIAIAISRLLFPNRPIDHFAAAFSNAGFMGIPLVRATLGNEAVFYTVGIIAVLNMLQWTYGVMVLTGKKNSVGLRSILLNPIVVGVLIGLALFLSGSGGQMPSVISMTLQGVSSLNAPLAMLVLGVYLAQTEPVQMLVSIPLYKISAVRLLLIPFVTLAVFWLIPCDLTVKMAVLIAAAAPVGANVAVYAQIHDLDYPYACQSVALSTALSILSLPIVLFAAAMLS